MPRVTRGSSRRQKRKKILARAKGYYQAKSKLYRYAREAVDRSLKFAYIGRRLKKRDFRSLWIIRIGAGVRQHGLSYSRFMHGLKLAGIEINRKMLAEMAVRDPDTFGKLVAQVSQALKAPRAKEPEAAPQPVAKPAASKAKVKAAESPPSPPEAAPAKAVKAEAKAAGEAEAAPAKAAEPEAKEGVAAPPTEAKPPKAETKEAAAPPPAEAKPSKKVRKRAVKKTASKAAPEEEATASEAAKPVAKPSPAAKPRKSSVGAKKKAAKPSKASPKSEGTQTPSDTTSSD